MALLVDFDAQLRALARLIEMEVVHSGGYAQNKYGVVSGGGGCADMLPSGLVYQVRVMGDDGRSYVFQRETLEQTAAVIRIMPRVEDRQALQLVYLTYGSLAEKAAHIGISKQSLNYRRNAAVQRFAHHWHEHRHGIRLARGAGVMGRFDVGACGND